MTTLKNFNLMLQSSFRVTTTWEGGTERSPIDPPLPHTCTATPIISIAHQSGTFLIKDEPTLARHNHPDPIVCLRVRSWCCTSHGFGQMYNEGLVSIIPASYRAVPAALKVFCAWLLHPSFPTPGNPGSFCS